MLSFTGLGLSTWRLMLMLTLMSDLRRDGLSRGSVPRLYLLTSVFKIDKEKKENLIVALLL
jgi:hypothetical protein